MTDERLAELERLEQAATPGPWEMAIEPEVSGVIATEMPTLDGKHYGIAIIPHWEPGMSAIEWPQKDANGRFICAVRNALPELLDEVERLRARVEVLETTVEEAVINDPDAKYGKLLRKALEATE